MRASVFKITLLIFLFSFGHINAIALPKCSDQSFKDNCYGTQINADGSIYVGSFMANKYSGKGEFTLSNGAKYVGDFQNGLQSGKGFLTLPSGNTYDGEWRDGLRNGFGIFYYKDTGAKYEGTWLNGNQKDGIVKYSDNTFKIYGEGLTSNQGNSIDIYKNRCIDLGFKKETEGFAKCVLQLSK